MDRLKGKAFIITGATSGMGKGIAELFAEEGAKLILSGRDQSRGLEIKELLSEFNPDIRFLQGDVTEVSYNQGLVDEAEAHFGRLDGVITNAGMLGLDKIVDLSPEKWQKTMATNLDSVFYLLKYAIPAMQKNGGGVGVINASIAAWKSFPNHPAYCASKAGLVALARQAAVEYGPDIRINIICPGPVDTPLIHDSAKAFPDPAKAVSDAADGTIMKRLGLPRDIAKLALFLASDDSSWITGSSFTIDGGIMAKG